MTTAPQPTFFVAGGTVPHGSPSYVERAADRELYEALIAREYCYVLNSRQMGKSSLAVRTVSRLAEAGVRTAFVDLTRIGAANVSLEQWYAGLLVETGRTLGLRSEAAAFLKEHKELSPSQRYLSFLQERVLPSSAGGVVLMIDEIDAVRSLSFSTDELFAGIRQLHNGRASDPDLKRLTFCLLGAALPSDLIRDPRSTPFNVGRRIDLRDFLLEEAQPLAGALHLHPQPPPAREESGPRAASNPRGKAEGAHVLERVLYWTGGHPFLSQTLCSELSQLDGELSHSKVDALVRERYLEARARESDTNLADVGNRLLGRGDPNVGESERANTLSLYSKLLKIGIPDDESNPTCARIKMSGVARLHGGKLTIRNRIYKQVFGPRWIRENMPGQELRRQRKAFWKGALRTGGISVAVISVIGALAVNNARLRTVAEEGRRKAEYDTYIASMRALPLALEQGDLEEISRTLDSLKHNPARGWEWEYWRYAAHPSRQTIPMHGFLFGNEYTRDGHGMLAVSIENNRVGLLDLRTQRIVREFSINTEVHGQSTAYLVNGDRQVLVASPNGWLQTYDLASGTSIRKVRVRGLPPDFTGSNKTAAGDIYAIRSAGDAQRSEIVQINPKDLSVRNVFAFASRASSGLSVSRDGKLAAWVQFGTSDSSTFELVVASIGNGEILEDVPVKSASVNPQISPNGDSVAYVPEAGKIAIRSLRSHTERQFKSPFRSLWMLQYSPDGMAMLVCGTGRRAALYDFPRGKFVRQYLDAGFAGFTPSGKEVYTSYKTIHLYDRNEPQSIRHLDVPGIEVSLLDDGRLITRVGGEFVFRDLLQSGHIVGRRQTPATKFSLLPDGTTWLGFGGTPAVFCIGRAGSRQALLTTPMPSIDEAYGLAFSVSPDRRFVALLGQVYDLQSADPRTPVLKIPRLAPAVGAAFSPDGRYLMFGDQSGMVSYWRVGDWRHPVWRFQLKESGGLRIARFSSRKDRAALVLGLDDILVLSTADGHLVTRLTGHSQTVNGVGWSPDDRRLVTCSEDHTVRLWDSANGRQIGILGQPSSAIDVRFLPGGRTIVSTGSNPSGTVVDFWRTEDRL